jgi:tRNA G10  N-methylase Trm11
VSLKQLEVDAIIIDIPYGLNNNKGQDKRAVSEVFHS